MNVKNMVSKTLQPVSNQFILTGEKGGCKVEEFQSYGTTIVRIITDSDHNITIYLDEDKWDYSNTTGKYRNMFLGDTTREIKEKIKSGEYILADLNS